MLFFFWVYVFCRPHGGIHPELERVLRGFRLTAKNAGVFLVVSQKVYKLLMMVEPFVTFGYPNKKSVLELIRKRGFIKQNWKRVTLNNNVIVEEHFGHENILSIEDLVHEILSLGPKFIPITKFLRPFQLTVPPGGFKNKNRKFINGGDHGYRGEEINDLIDLMN